MIPSLLVRSPTMEEWADRITAVLDDLGSREAVLPQAVAPASATAALSRGDTSCRAQSALVVLEGYADSQGRNSPMGSMPRTSDRCHGRRVGHGGWQHLHQLGHAVEPGDPERGHDKNA